jgi:hypothetical protein
MKRKIKIILNLFNFGIIFMLLSCEKDLYEDAIYKSSFNVNLVNSIALKNNAELMKTLNTKKILKSNLEGRIINDSINGFTIETEKVKYLKSGNFHSYTFEVLEKQSGKLDNLVLMSQTDGTYVPYYVSYTLTDAEMESINSTSPMDFSNKSKVSKLTNTNIVSNIFGKGEPNCNMNYSWQEVITITPCQIDGCWDPEWTGTITSHILIGTLQCSTDQINDILGTSPVNGGGFSIGNNNPPQKDPCSKLTAKTNEAVFKNKVSQISTPSNFYASHETGFSQGKDPITGVTGYTNQIGTGTSNTLPILSNTTTQAHVHNTEFVVLDSNGDPKIYIPIPSGDDLYGFCTTYQTNAWSQNVASQDTCQLTIQTEDKGTFAFMSLVETLDCSDSILFDFGKLKSDYYERAKKLIENDNLNNSSARKMLLNLMKKNGLYDLVGLYLATNTEKTQWSRLTLNSSGEIIPIPCN